MKRSIGKNTLGSGKKMMVSLKEYDRSTHDLSYIWKSTMAPGVLVPFMKLYMLRGDTFDIELEASAMTLPTNGALFASLKLQLDIFTADVRLYQKLLHNNTKNVGLAMNTVKLPQIVMEASAVDWNKDLEGQQINPSCLYAYLGMRGIAGKSDAATVDRLFNAIPHLAYVDCWANYYANKQETKGWVIHNTDVVQTITLMEVYNIAGSWPLPQNSGTANVLIDYATTMVIDYSGDKPDVGDVALYLTNGSRSGYFTLDEIFEGFLDGVNQITCNTVKFEWLGWEIEHWRYEVPESNKKPQLLAFDLTNVDDMRESILAQNKASSFKITAASPAPYGTPLKKEGTVWSKTTVMEGLLLKTYQSDVFNNWIKTESITGTGSINDITRIDTTGGSITIDTLTFKRKVYNMLNAVAVSGGSYDDWLDVNYQEGYNSKPEIPVYHGGLSKEIVFQEVVSNSGNENEPLGTIGGRGTLSRKHKGGYVRLKANEHCVAMGIVSITPRIDESQGNDWDVNLVTMDDFHKPAMDGIGFQDLITDQMAYWDTEYVTNVGPVFKSAGKQPAWINYMTNYNKTYGNFALRNEQMFMTLNRRYTPNRTTKRIGDLTTYIDPANFNYIFADASRSAQNFWVQIGVNIEARRVMSAKIMPQG